MGQPWINPNDRRPILCYLTMSKEKLQSLIDRVIGKDGILRVPAYWMRKVFLSVIDYVNKAIETSAKATESNAITSATAASKEYTDQQIAELDAAIKSYTEKYMGEKEEIISASLVDLNNKIAMVIERLNQANL